MIADDLFFSRRLRRNFVTNSVRPPLGAAHYSYSNVSDKFLDMFEQRDIVATELIRPEIYALPDPAFPRRPVHIIFKPFDEIRYLHGGYNIAHVAWEFEKFSVREDWPVGDPRYAQPFSDYVAMMRGLDQIWVGSHFASSVFAQYGLQNIKVLPAPIRLHRKNLSALRRERSGTRRFHFAAADNVSLQELSERAIQGFARETPPRRQALSGIAGANKKVFLFVGNHHDLRKNFAALLDGFSAAALLDSRLVLIVKLVMDNAYVTRQDFFRQLPMLYELAGRTFGEVTLRNIFFTTDFLDPGQMETLYRTADFYLSASVAEGQNLPILEGMGNGLVPVSGQHTAMLDFISKETGVVIASSRRPAPFAFAQAYGISGLTLDTIDAADVSAAVSAAAGLGSDAYAKLQEAAWAKVVEEFSYKAVMPMVEAALAECDA